MQIIDDHEYLTKEDFLKLERDPGIAGDGSLFYELDNVAKLFLLGQTAGEYQENYLRYLNPHLRNALSIQLVISPFGDHFRKVMNCAHELMHPSHELPLPHEHVDEPIEALEFYTVRDEKDDRIIGVGKETFRSFVDTARGLIDDYPVNPQAFKARRILDRVEQVLGLQAQDIAPVQATR